METNRLGMYITRLYVYMTKNNTNSHLIRCTVLTITEANKILRLDISHWFCIPCGHKMRGDTGRDTKRAPNSTMSQ